MVDLALTSVQEMIRGTARDFLSKEYPRSRVREIEEREGGFSRVLWDQMVDLAWPRMIIPERYGGIGGSLTDLAILLEEMGRACLATPFHSSAVLGALSVLGAGTEDQRERLLPDVAAGKRILSLAFTEASYGWGPESVAMTAKRDGDNFILDGTKAFIPHAQVVDTFIVSARLPESDPDRLSLFLVDRLEPEVTITSMSGWTGEPLSAVRFESVTLPGSALLGRVDEGWDVLQPVLASATAALCAYMVGGCQQLFESCVEFSRERIAFGVPISTLQRVQDLIINIVNNLDAARWTTYEAVWKIDNNYPVEKVAEAVSIAKAVASDGYISAAEAANHVHGGISVDKQFGLYLYTKQARTLFSYLGDPYWHRRRIAAGLGL